MIKKDRKIRLERDPPDGRLLEIIQLKIKIPRRTNTPIGKRLTKELKTMWLKKERRKSVALVATWTTTPGENAENRSWLPQPSLTEIGETLNNRSNLVPVLYRYTNPRQPNENNLQRLI